MSRYVLYRDEQVAQIAGKLNLTKISVEEIISCYVWYLVKKLDRGKSIKFLNVCYLKTDGKEEDGETLAYISSEIGRMFEMSGQIVYRVLTTFEEYLIKDLRNDKSYCIKGLLRIQLAEIRNGEYRARIKKSTVYNGKNIRVTTLHSFKRKVEVVPCKEKRTELVGC